MSESSNGSSNENGKHDTKSLADIDKETILPRFADYFVICGLDFNTGLEPDRFSGNFYNFLTYGQQK